MDYGEMKSLEGRMKSIVAFFVFAVLICSSSQAQPWHEDGFIYPEFAWRNGYKQYEPKAPVAKNLIGVWKRIGTVSYIGGGSGYADLGSVFADTIVFVNAGTEAGKVSAGFYRDDRSTIIMDVSFENHPDRYEAQLHYSMEGIAKTDGEYEEIEFFDYEYPRIDRYLMPAIKRFTSIGDKYIVLEHYTDDDKWEIKSNWYEVFGRSEVGVELPKVNVERYKFERNH